VAVTVGSTEVTSSEGAGSAGAGAEKVTAVVFDVGETLVDETRAWESHRQAFEWLGIDGPFGGFSSDQLYPDAVPCLRALRKRGLLVGAVGNMQALNEDVVRPYVDFVGSSERWGVEKPSPEFFERIVAEADRPVGEIAYVGDRVDNDVLPAKRAGMFAVHVGRGPWGVLHDASEADARIESLDELAEAFA
jgi:FMN phosphatase YigB (HAD superfamily)